MHSNIGPGRIVLALALGMLLTGCYEEIEPEPAAKAPAPAGGSDLGDQGAGSSLGKAKEAAEDTATKVQEHNEELMKQIEDQ